MIEYHMPDPRRLHPSTYELVHRHYFWLTDSYPWCVPIHQIYNTIKACAPDVNVAIASIRQATTNLLADMRTYPEEAWKLVQALPYVEEFFECVQETSAKLHNGEPARQANIEALNRSFAESERRSEEMRKRWQAEEAVGDAYFGGPGAYRALREAHYAAPTMQEWQATGERLNAFREAYHRGEQVVQPEPVQAELWEVPA